MRKLTKDEFVSKAVSIHGDKYDYSNVDYTNQITKVSIICKECGNIFWQTPNNHTNKNHPQGCPICRLKKISAKSQEMAKNAAMSFEEKARRIHGYKYDYSKVKYVNAHTNICIICNECGNEFWQSPNNHINSSHPQGCPNCACSSIGENKIKEYLDYNNIRYIHDKTCLDWLVNPKTSYKLRPDFYLPDYNMVIEYDGKQHFSSKNVGWSKEYNDIKERDWLKDKLCKEHNITVVRISNYSRIQETLKESLNGYKES